MKHFCWSTSHWDSSEVKYFKIRTAKHVTCNIRVAFDSLRVVRIESCEVLGNFNADI